MESGITAVECDPRRDPALRGVLQELGIIKHEIIDYGTDEEYTQEDSSAGHLYENGDNVDIPLHTGTSTPDVPNETTASKHILSHEVKKETEEEAVSTELPFHRNRIILGKKKPVSLEKSTKQDASDINNKSKMKVNKRISIKKDHDTTLIGKDKGRSRKRTKEYSEMERCLLVKVVVTDCYRSLLDGGCFCARCGTLFATCSARDQHEVTSHAAAATPQRSLRERRNRVVLTDSNCEEDLETNPTKLIKRKRTGEKPYECETCKLRFWGRYDLKMHTMIHTGERPFECKICQIRFNRKTILKRHVIQTHNGEKPFECKICQRRFPRRLTLKTHMASHSTEQPHECKICKVRYKHLVTLQRHHRRIHFGEKPFKCKTCNQRFRLINELKRHKFSHYGGKPFKCKTCKKRFSTNGDLRRHGVVHTKEQPFGCAICKRTFNLRSNLKRHCGSLGHIREALRL
ncbi:hypothetical protein JYU34_022024 [Plutella xylostella]|uniref:C2H2-type domain-containing protein n=1 Tax=Plutella xylostella TaxID=51655 RepID=A0ABQ7PRR0_PLUXY|nr:hypothetical protein JYU34_022024 [Plutella xylostella]